MRRASWLDLMPLSVMPFRAAAMFARASSIRADLAEGAASIPYPRA